MAADLQAVGVLAQMIGVVDRPAREPEHLLFQLAQDLDVVGHGVKSSAIRIVRPRAEIRSRMDSAYAGMSG